MELSDNDKERVHELARRFSELASSEVALTASSNPGAVASIDFAEQVRALLRETNDEVSRIFGRESSQLENVRKIADMLNMENGGVLRGSSRLLIEMSEYLRRLHHT